jgi:RNA recognition motif-containing protein
MSKRFYVENLPPDITPEKLKNIFDQIGEVQSVRIKTEYLTMRPKCSGVVDMALEVDAYRAVNCFEGAEFKNGKIHLKEEDPLMERARHVLTDLSDGYDRVSTKMVADITDSYERVSAKLSKDMKDLEKRIEEKIDEIKKR